ncbi:MAG: 50S ribosomal protein L7Ae [Candidatus Micrarchaeia archaeon]
MAKSYVKFNVGDDISKKTYELVKLASSTGKVRKGTNEATKSIERGLAKIVVIAEDVEPEEIVMHIPEICKEKGIPFTYVPSKKELGNSAGMNVQSAAVAVEDAGNGNDLMKDIINNLPKVKE